VFLLGRAVIFSNGEYRDFSGVKQHLCRGDFLICADGALGKLMSMQIRPDLLVGDFDSVEPSLLEEAERAGINRLNVPVEKDFTDTELALREALKAGYRDILLVGAFGGRLDHELGNLFLLPPFVSAGARISLTDGETDAYLVTKELQLSGCRGKVVSLLPLTAEVQGVTISGFYYPLQDYTLHWGQTIGISNLPLVDNPSIRLQSGMLLVVVTDAA
jgi:thiamine pyrophosphokinase